MISVLAKKPRTRNERLTGDERARLCAMLCNGATTKAVAAAFNLNPRTVQLWRHATGNGKYPTPTGRDSAEKRHVGGHIVVPKPCFVNECYVERVEGEKFCARHLPAKPAAAKMMAGRA